MRTISPDLQRSEARSPDPFPSRPEYAEVSREVRPAPPRYRNEIGKYSVHRASHCAACGRCVETCRHGVHVRPEGYLHVLRPYDYRCIGSGCKDTGRYCVDACPRGALALSANPVAETLGDHRWTPDLLMSTWAMAETGRPPGPQFESEVGASGGGFDRLRFRFPDTIPGGL